MNLHPIFVASFSDELQKLAGGGGRLAKGVLERVMPQLGGASKAMSTGARRAAGAVPAPMHRLTAGAAQQKARMSRLVGQGRQAVQNPTVASGFHQPSPISGVFEKVTPAGMAKASGIAQMIGPSKGLFRSKFTGQMLGKAAPKAQSVARKATGAMPLPPSRRPGFVRPAAGAAPQGNPFSVLGKSPWDVGAAAA